MSGSQAINFIVFGRRLAIFCALLIFLAGLWQGTSVIDVSKSLLGSSLSAPFGFDSLGRPLLSRIALGTFNSVLVAAGGAVLALGIGLLVGVLNVFFLRRIDGFILRSLDILNTIPNFVYVMAIGGMLWNWPPILRLCISTGLVHWIVIARIMRLKLYETEQKDFIVASKALGASRMRLLFRHMIPQFADDLLLIGINQFSAILSQEAFISFIGFGFSPPETSLGLLLQDGWRMLAVSPHLVFGPGLMLMLILFSLYSLRMERLEKSI